LDRIEGAGGQLVAVSPEQPDHSLTLIEKNELEFTVLSDSGNQVARQFGLVFKLPPKLQSLYKEFGINLAEFNGDESGELPIPATYIIDTDGTITYAFVDADYQKRAEPADVVRALQSL
jgi:peroxiredoxin